jgi:Na+/H+ antiporter NhaA
MSLLQSGAESAASPRALLSQFAQPLRRFMATEAGSAWLLLGAAVFALAWANSPWSSEYFDLWDTVVAVSVGDNGLSMDLRHWVNDGLMAVFFFVIGLEVRREFSVGELTDPRRVTIPAAAAAGGILVPALLYLALNPRGDPSEGWGLVIGTDTAMLLGALALVGPRQTPQLRVFLLTLTIFDDIVAVSVIGFVYSDSIDFVALAVAGVCLGLIALLSRTGVWRTWIYALVGLVLWVATVESGFHATIAGMLAGLLVAAYAPRRDAIDQAAALFRAFRQAPSPHGGFSAKQGLQRAVSMNERLQERLHPLSSFIIVPIFAVANAGVDLGDGVLSDALGSSITWGVVAGLVLGKMVGISLFGLTAVRLGWGDLPRGVGPGQLVAGAALSGLGFSVSLLIADLAFASQEAEDRAIVGILLAIPVAAAAGWIAFRVAERVPGAVAAALPTVLSPPVIVGKDNIRGPASAPLTLVEYGDYQCPYCGTATGVIKELRERFGDNLRYVFRHLPLSDVHPGAELASQAAEAAGAQGKFWEMHDLLFANQDQLEFEDLLGYAGQLDLDVEKFTRDLGDARHARHIEKDVESAEASGVHGTPTFFIDDTRYRGPHDAASLTRVLAAELEQARREQAAAG